MLLGLAARCAGLIINISEFGYRDVTIARTDMIFIDLRGRLALFMDTMGAGLTVGHRGRANAYTDYFPVSAPDFSASGVSIAVRTSLRRARLRIWVVSAQACPGPASVASLVTDRVLLLETGIDGPLCLFPRLRGALYRIDVETLRGIPRILFFTARGGASSSKICQGEADVCSAQSAEPFFVVFEGATRVNFTFRVENYRRPPPDYCAVAPVPTLLNKTLVRPASRLVDPGDPCCLTEENTVWQVAVGMGVLLLAASAAALVLRIVGTAGVRRCLDVDDGACCVGARETYESCF
jgi:hypothetical protein